MNNRKIILAVLVLALAALACRKATPCDTNPAACVTPTAAVFMQIVEDTPTPTPPPLATLFPTWTPAATVTATPAPEAIGERGLP